MGTVLEMPKCSRGHLSRAVVFGGCYGKGARRRQLYKCTPEVGKPHRFVPAMPRVLVSEGHCWECENPIHTHEGPPFIRGFRWPMRTAITALRSVSKGVSYIRAAKEVRLISSKAGEIIGDWVEVYTEDLWESLGPKSWPAHIVCDTKPFYVRDAAGKSTPAYYLYVIVGSDGIPNPLTRKFQWQPVLFIALPTYDQRAWESVLRILSGRPLVVTADEDNSLMKAIQTVWPLDKTTGEAPPRINYCLHHIKVSFEKRVKLPPSVTDPQTSSEIETAQAFGEAFDQLGRSANGWANFITRARALNNAGINKWLQRKNRDTHIYNQLLTAAPGEAHSNAAAEAELRWITGQWSGRHASYRNAQRTNRLLKLMVLHRRGDDDVKVWTEILHAQCNARGGRPATLVRSVRDRYGQGVRPSLRA